MGEKELNEMKKYMSEEEFVEFVSALELYQRNQIEKIGEEVISRLKRGNSEYGESNGYAAKIVKIFRTISGKEFTVDDYYLLMIITKLVREYNKSKYDNILDLAGYSLLWLKFKK